MLFISALCLLFLNQHVFATSPPAPAVKRPAKHHPQALQKRRAFPPNRGPDNDLIVIHKSLQPVEAAEKGERAFPPNRHCHPESSDSEEYDEWCHRPPHPTPCNTTPIHCTPLHTTTTSSSCTPTTTRCPKPTEHCKKEFAVTCEKVKACDAQAACAQMGMKLADLRSDNWDRAVKAMFAGIGPNEYGWVHSWNDDLYLQAPCIALYTGLTDLGGAVNVPLSCYEPRHALCQRGIRHH